MCEFCTKHGEGQKWYLQAKNWADDLLSDVERRNLIKEFFGNPSRLTETDQALQGLENAPGFVRRVIQWRAVSRQKAEHYGQVVPIEDAERILDFTNSVVRLGCICRYARLGTEQRYCYGVSMVPGGGQWSEILREIDVSYLTGPDSTSLEMLTKEEALAAWRGHEKEGLCHTVWTFITPFLGGVCNCDRSDCLAMSATVTHSFPTLFRAEYVAEISADSCNGCRACMRMCQFGAIAYSAAQKKAVIDPRRCYGCGICRSACNQNAVSLQDRASVPLVARLW